MIELVLKYRSEGWIELKGDHTLGFVSPCGEVFNCYSYDTGEFFSFGTMWAVRATKRVNYED